MDYDSTDIPAVYDRGRDHGPEVLLLWMNFVAARVGSQRLNTILDLGCGTGRFSESLAAHFEAEVVGIDPSEKMLDQARRKQRDRRVRYQVGCGEAIPLPNDSVDLIFMSMSFHHFKDQMLAARECRRVLRDGGKLALSVWGGPEKNPWVTVTGMTVVQMGHQPGGDPFGPGGMFSMSEPDTIRSMLSTAGFTDITVEDASIADPTGLDIALFSAGATTSRAFLAAVDDVQGFSGGFDVRAEVAPGASLTDPGTRIRATRGMSPLDFDVVAGESVVPAKARQVGGRGSVRRRRGLRLLLVAIIIGALVLGVGLGWYVRRRRASRSFQNP